jgi:hypothetical protein
MANIVRAFVDEMLPVWLAGRAARKAAAQPRLITKPVAANGQPPVRKLEPYRPSPEFRLRNSHL